MANIQKKPTNISSADMERAVKEAELYITNTLRLDESKMTQEEISERKRELAKKIRLVVASEFGIKPSSIRIGIKNNDTNTFYAAYWDKHKPGSKFYGEIVYDKQFFERSSFERFIEVTDHELGHVGQSLKEDSGENVDAGLNIMDQAISEGDGSETDLRHSADKGEFDADMFAYGKSMKWIIEARKKGIGGTKKTLNQLYRVAKRGGGRIIDFVTSKVTLAMLGFMDSVGDIVKPYRMGSVLNPRDMYERNLKNEANGHRSVEEAEKYLKNIYGRTGLTQGEKLRIADSMSVVLADSIGMEPRDMGTVVFYGTGQGLGYSRVGEGDKKQQDGQKAVNGFVFIGDGMLRLDGKEYMEQMREYYKTVEKGIRENPQAREIAVGFEEPKKEENSQKEAQPMPILEYL